MKFSKLNQNWTPEPNTPQSSIYEIEGGIGLKFKLNATNFEYIDEGEIAKLEFSAVYAYRPKTITKEEYINGLFRFNNDQLPWGDFYELMGTNWRIDFPNDKVIVDDKIPESELRHFVILLEGQAFECIAKDYRFYIDNQLEEILDNKYPKGYLNFYLSMFASQFDKASLDNFKTYTNLYLQMQNKKEFSSLKEELKNIKKNKDLKLYLKYANAIGIADFGTKQLNDMVKVIETYKV